MNSVSEKASVLIQGGVQTPHYTSIYISFHQPSNLENTNHQHIELFRIIKKKDLEKVYRGKTRAEGGLTPVLIGDSLKVQEYLNQEVWKVAILGSERYKTPIENRASLERPLNSMDALASNA